MARFFIAFILNVLIIGLANSQTEKGELIYLNSFATAQMVNNWTMEGPGKLSFQHGWMTMFSPNQQMHHVFWCPENFPESFIAEWEAQNIYSEAGLAIVFFAAKGINGKDIFHPSQPPRDGTFKQYTLGDVRSYHISYYANAAHNKNRGHANLRKNNTFTLLQKGKEGIPTLSRSIHRIRLEKQGPTIRLWVNNKKTIDFSDKAPYWGDGKIGFRQMQWTKFRYRNFKVWRIKNHNSAEKIKQH